MLELGPVFLTVLIVWLLFFAATLFGYRIGKRIPILRRAIVRLALISATPLLLVAIVASLFIFSSTRRGAASQESVGAPSPGPRETPKKKGDEKKEGLLKNGPSSTELTGSSNDALQKAVDALPVGDVVFHHGDQMQLRKQEAVQIRISEDLTQDLARGLSAQGVTERDQVKVSTSMKVRLSGDPYFDVKSLNDEEQLVTKNGYTEWAFTVLPLKTGRWPLHLVITAVIRTPWGDEKYKDYPVKDEFVQVRVTAFAEIGYFIENNWQWLASAIVIPLLLWVVKKRIEKRKKAKAAAPGAAPSPQPVAASTEEEKSSKPTQKSA